MNKTSTRDELNRHSTRDDLHLKYILTTLLLNGKQFWVLFTLSSFNFTQIWPNKYLSKESYNSFGVFEALAELKKNYTSSLVNLKWFNLGSISGSRLEDCVLRSKVGAGDEARTADESADQVADDGAVQVGQDDDVELPRVGHQLHATDKQNKFWTDHS